MAQCLGNIIKLLYLCVATVAHAALPSCVLVCADFDSDLGSDAGLAFLRGRHHLGECAFDCCWSGPACMVHLLITFICPSLILMSQDAFVEAIEVGG